MKAFITPPYENISVSGGIPSFQSWPVSAPSPPFSLKSKMPLNTVSQGYSQTSLSRLRGMKPSFHRSTIAVHAQHWRHDGYLKKQYEHILLVNPSSHSWISDGSQTQSLNQLQSHMTIKPLPPLVEPPHTFPRGRSGTAEASPVTEAIPSNVFYCSSMFVVFDLNGLRCDSGGASNFLLRFP